MATPSKIQLSLSARGEYYRPGITAESASTASEILQENHEKHHIFFNEDQYHNHVAHHILTLYALGATPTELQFQYDRNKIYQRPAGDLEPEVVKDMHEPARYKTYLGNEKYYHDFLVFFQQEMEEKGWQSVLSEYLFKGDERADDMLVRLYAGFLHPIIHLGFGIEFQQPAIIAEALAQTAIHSTWMHTLFLGAEKAARSQRPSNKSLITLFDEVRKDDKLYNSPHWEDGNKIRDGILKRAPDEMIKYASQWTVTPEQLQEKTAEMMNFVVYYTAAAQRPSKAIKFDFYFMHCVNSSIFFSAFLKQDWLSTANKVRLLEWKGRNDLAMYVSRRSPDPLLNEITDYKPDRPKQSSAEAWEDVIERVRNFNDDGHAAKLVRAIAHAEKVCEPYEKEGKVEYRIRGEDVWLKLGQMAIDSVDGYASKRTWVRSAGFDEAWEQITDRREVAAR